MSTVGDDPNLFAAVPPPTDDPPPPQDPIPPIAAEAPPAWLGGVMDVVKQGFESLAASRQDPATASNAQPPMAATWYETLNQQQREALKGQGLVDPEQTQSFIASQEAEYSRRKMIQDAAPLVTGQAYMIVELFKGKQNRNPYFTQIEPIFDKIMASEGDLRPLVNMPDSQRQNALSMRWSAAEAQVLKDVLKNPPKQTPTLTTATGPAPATPMTVETDPLMNAMDAWYKFTPEQKAALQAAQGSE